MSSERFEIILVRSYEEDLFSEEYQKELSDFASQANISSQRRQTGDSLFGGSWALGEFIFNHADAVIGALAGVSSAWIGRRTGRKLRLKVGEIEMEANKPEDFEKMMRYVRDLQEKKRDESER